MNCPVDVSYAHMHVCSKVHMSEHTVTTRTGVSNGICSDCDWLFNLEEAYSIITRGALSLVINSNEPSWYTYSLLQGVY